MADTVFRTKRRCTAVVRNGLNQLNDVSLGRVVRYKGEFLLDGEVYRKTRGDDREAGIEY